MASIEKDAHDFGTLEDRMKKLAQEARENDPRFKQVSGEDWDRIDKVFWHLQRRYPWYSSVCAGIRRILTHNPSIPTAAVGWKEGQPTLFINVEWFFSLENIDQQLFVILHETDHLVRNHLYAMKKWPERSQALNFCMDAIINTSLKREFGLTIGKEIPNDLVTYEKFLEVVNNQPNEPELQGEKWPGMNEGTFVHEAVSEELVKYLPRTPDDEIPMIKELYGAGEFFDDEESDEEMQETVMENLTDEATKEAGSEPGHLQKSLERFKDKKNRDWRRLLRGLGYSNKIDQYSTRGRINKRHPFLRPGRLTFTYPRVLVVIDRSGSVGSSETQEFIAECNTLVDQVELDMIFVDCNWDPSNPETFVKGVEDVKDIWKNWVDMGGGTNFDDVYEYLLKGEGRGQYESVVLLTDGFLFSTPRIPARLGTQNNVLMLTPYYDQQCYDEAIKLGYQVCIVDDAKKIKRF